MKIPRRTFLSNTVAGAASLAAAVRTTSASPNDEIVVSIIGVGGQGTGHVKRVLDRKDTRIAAICDVDQANRERAGQLVNRDRGQTPKLVEDFRDLLDDKSINAFIIATPHHWHAPIAVRAMQAGKDVYVEKPASHVFNEGRILIEAQRKYNRIFQHGTQMRSSEVTKKAGELLKSGVIGEVKMSKAWNCQQHTHKAPAASAPVPPGVNYDLWQGPAAEHDFNPNRYNGNWNWYRGYGNGDIGGDGIHDLDMARWGLGVTTHPSRITAHGSRIQLEGEREFPDNMTVAYQYDDQDKVLLYEDRGWTPYGIYGFDSGNCFYGTEGYMIFSRRGYFQVYLGKKDEKGPGMADGPRGLPEHLYNFLDCVRSRQQTVAPAEVAHLSCGLVHLGEIANRVGRIVHFDPASEQIKDDAEATALMTKTYRYPWKMPNPI